LRSSSYSLTAHDAEDRPRWDRDFRELGCCLSIACDIITAEVGTALPVDDYLIAEA
jgi:hypothetical protein